jgi:ATP-dependent exoDNAse (exonuclease V) alpha subunit
MFDARGFLCDEQYGVYENIVDYLKAKRVDRPYMLVEGLAGVGKTRLLIAVAHRFPNALLTSPFGKASSNLSRKTGFKASTVYSAIYQFRGEDEHGRLHFDPKHEDGSWHGRIALLDEHSTCGQKLGRDLMATGCRAIAFGDPGQLQPVNDKLYFTDADFTLREIHRQAKDSGIIRQAHRIRAGLGYVEDGPDVTVKRQCSEEDVLQADMLLSWTNATRRQLNHLKRAYLGYAGRPPLAGEPIMCLRNDHRAGVLNGAIYELLEDHVPGCGVIPVRNDRGELVYLSEAWIEDFEGPRPDIEDQQAHPFAMSYAATVHKMIGSEVDRVLLVDEYRREEEYISWCYTGFTRAAKHITVKV